MRIKWYAWICLIIGLSCSTLFSATIFSAVSEQKDKVMVYLGDETVVDKQDKQYTLPDGETDIVVAGMEKQYTLPDDEPPVDP